MDIKKKKCKVCKKEFRQVNSLQNCCSYKCAIELKKKKEGKSTNDKSIKKTLTELSNLIYNKNRKDIIKEQFNKLGYNKCENCHSKGGLFGLEMHHLIWRSEKPLHKNIHNKLNLYYVCKDCHDKFHNKKSYRNEIVKKRKLNLLFGNDILNK